jgi:acyl carrier protein
MNEIANILLENKDIREVACMIGKNPQEVEHIIAYIVASGDVTPDLEYCNAMLVRRLPAYMVPSHIILIKEIPKNAVGKIDRKQLPEPEWHPGSKVKQEDTLSETETALVEIFEKVLKITPISTKDNFLKLGANSLSLFVAFTEVEKKFGVKLDVNAIVQTPDIKSIAAFIDQKESS